MTSARSQMPADLALVAGNSGIICTRAHKAYSGLTPLPLSRSIAASNTIAKTSPALRRSIVAGCSIPHGAPRTQFAAA